MAALILHLLKQQMLETSLTTFSVTSPHPSNPSTNLISTSTAYIRPANLSSCFPFPPFSFLSSQQAGEFFQNKSEMILSVPPSDPLWFPSSCSESQSPLMTCRALSNSSPSPWPLPSHTSVTFPQLLISEKKRKGERERNIDDERMLDQLPLVRLLLGINPFLSLNGIEPGTLLSTG
uniref:Uncharacterized protein n=1 Tax=Pipistrellus kuhlii TaxID=59472 RepID=A0A7J7VBN2_PIPKU|nr:hypothetical protein mPipKuh1_008522 [Pipistrellus kuhlii]